MPYDAIGILASDRQGSSASADAADRVKYFEDHDVGETMGQGRYVVSKEEISGFAEQFARIVAIDPDKPVRTSGAHGFAIYQKLQVELTFANGSAPAMIAALGMDEMRWRHPINAGDVLTLEGEVLEKSPSRSKADRGVIRFRYDLRNQFGEITLTLIAILLVKRRPPDAA